MALIDAESVSWEERGACSGNSAMTSLFFEDEENLSNVYEARKICSECPVFEQCQRYSCESFPLVPFGIFAGLPASTRKAIYAREMMFEDWRTTWDPESFQLTGLLPTVPIRCEQHLRLAPTGDSTYSCDDCGARVRLIRRSYA